VRNVAIELLSGSIHLNEASVGRLKFANLVLQVRDDALPLLPQVFASPIGRSLFASPTQICFDGFSERSGINWLLKVPVTAYA